jgi:hypothetical protein
MLGDCPKCGAHMTEISPPGACPLVLRCTLCAYEQSVQWDPAPPIPNPKDLERVRAAICWRDGRPSHSEMLAMRQFIPEFRDRPMHELHTVLNDAPNWPLGEHTRGSARRIQEQARKFGLAIEVHETAS